MNYNIYGPFEMARDGVAISRARLDKQHFWQTVEAQAEGLSEACGCYIFVLRNRAWYVGLCERQSFKKECFSLHKIVQYNDALRSITGKPSLLLVAKETPEGRFVRPSKRGHQDIRLLENILIGSALGRNRNLKNVKNTTLLREMCVPGIINTKQGQGRASSVQCLKAAIGA